MSRYNDIYHDNEHWAGDDEAPTVPAQWVTMVNPAHPCYRIDVVDCVDPSAEEFAHLQGQGYMPADSLALALVQVIYGYCRDVNEAEARATAAEAACADLRARVAELESRGPKLIHLLAPGVSCAAWGIDKPYLCGARHYPGAPTDGDGWADDAAEATCIDCLRAVAS